MNINSVLVFQEKIIELNCGTTLIEAVNWSGYSIFFVHFLCKDSEETENHGIKIFFAIIDNCD